MVRAVSWKAVSDGSNQGRTGYQREPYLELGHRGAANCSADELEEVIRYAHDRGWQVMVHANGDAAVDRTVGAYEKALATHRPGTCGTGSSTARSPTTAHFRAMAQTGVSPSFLMNHVYYWGQRAARSYPRPGPGGPAGRGGDALRTRPAAFVPQRLQRLADVSAARRADRGHPVDQATAAC